MSSQSNHTNANPRPATTDSVNTSESIDILFGNLNLNHQQTHQPDLNVVSHDNIGDQSVDEPTEERAPAARGPVRRATASLRRRGRSLRNIFGRGRARSASPPGSDPSNDPPSFRQRTPPPPTQSAVPPVDALATSVDSPLYDEDLRNFLFEEILQQAVDFDWPPLPELPSVPDIAFYQHPNDHLDTNHNSPATGALDPRPEWLTPLGEDTTLPAFPASPEPLPSSDEQLFQGLLERTEFEVQDAQPAECAQPQTPVSSPTVPQAPVAAPVPPVEPLRRSTRARRVPATYVQPDSPRDSDSSSSSSSSSEFDNEVPAQQSPPQASPVPQPRVAANPRNPVVSQPVAVPLPVNNQLPGRPVTLPANPSDAEIAYFRSIWRPGMHMPDTIRDHVFSCPAPGCKTRVQAKRTLLRHWNLHHSALGDPNLALPQRARQVERRRWVLVDENGRDLRDQGDGQDSDGE